MCSPSVYMLRSRNRNRKACVCLREGLDPCRNCIHRVAATTIRFYVQPVRQLDIIATGDVAHRIGYVNSIRLAIKTLYTPNSSFTVYECLHVQVDMILLPKASQQQDLKLKSVHLEFRFSLITCTLCILSQTGLCALIVVYTKVKIKVTMFTGPE